MGRPARSGTIHFPRMLAGLLVPVLGFALLSFYYSNRPQVVDESASTPIVNAEGSGSMESTRLASSIAIKSQESDPEPVYALEEQPTTGPSPTQKPTVTPSPKIPLVNVTQAKVNTEDGLNIRSGPSTNFGVLRVAPFGELVELTGESASEGNLSWVELVEDGWVQDRYLDFE